MLRDRPDAAELLELLDFHPPSWRRYYYDLFSRYPTLAEDWVHFGFLNLPKTRVPNEQEWQWDRKLEARRHQRHAKQALQAELILAELRARTFGLFAKRGAARSKALRALDRRLDELGLRPRFPGGTRIPKSERPAIKRRYQELRGLIAELRTVAAEVDTTEPKYWLALLIRFPLFSEQEIDMISRSRYRRRDATAEAAMAVLAGRFKTQPDTLERYLFPR